MASNEFFAHGFCICNHFEAIILRTSNLVDAFTRLLDEKTYGI